MKFVALISGGKDSIYSIMLALNVGHELVAGVHLAKPRKEEEESFLYQTAASEAVQIQVEECLGVPLISVERKGTSKNTSLVYEEDNDENDEVEDLYRALAEAQRRFPEIQAVSSGAILSTYQRVRIEQVCGRLGLQPLGYLWRKGPQSDLLDEMLNARIHAVLVKTAAPPGLLPRKHLGKSLSEVRSLLDILHEKYQLHVCGEGGEYETLVLDCPLFKKRLVLESTRVVTDEDDDMIGSLVVERCLAEEKESPGSLPSNAMNVGTVGSLKRDAAIPATAQSVPIYPYIRKVPGGLWTISSLWSPTLYRDDVSSEAKEIFQVLRKLLEQNGCTPRDVLFVHLYLIDMEHFSLLNSHYRSFFGVVLPPSRSTIAVHAPLPGGRNVMLDVMVQCGSGDYLRANHVATPSSNPYTVSALAQSHTRLRNVLHVQTISHWAPVCVGPYSQANTLRDSLHFVSGQIGLEPATMKLIAPTWQGQLRQACVNLASVLDALDESRLDQALAGTVFLAESAVSKLPWGDIAESICREYWANNANVSVGAVESRFASLHTDQYEDEETAKADRGTLPSPEQLSMICPVLVVSVSQMPVGALAEVETIVMTRRANECLTIQKSHEKKSHISQSGVMAEADDLSQPLWDTGHDFVVDHVDDAGLDSPVFEKIIWSVGHGGFHGGIVVASSSSEMERIDDIRGVLNTIVGLFADVAPSWFHLRLYFRKILDADAVRMAFQAAVSKQCRVEPSITSVAVGGIQMFHGGKKNSSPTNPILAIQGISVDPVKLQDEIWIRFGRSK